MVHVPNLAWPGPVSLGERKKRASSQKHPPFDFCYCDFCDAHGCTG